MLTRLFTIYKTLYIKYRVLNQTYHSKKHSLIRFASLSRTKGKCVSTYRHYRCSIYDYKNI